MTETPEETELDLYWLVSRMDASSLDLVLVEGFRHEPIPKILLFRADFSRRIEAAAIDSHVIAVASDTALHPEGALVPVLDINSPVQIRDFIVEWLKK